MVLDLMFFVFAALGFWMGFSRGIISTVFTIFSYFFGAIVAIKFSDGMTKFLQTTFNDDSPLYYLAGLLLSFVLAMFLIRMIARGLENVLKAGNVNTINQLLGGALLSSILVVLFSFLVQFGDEARMIEPKTKNESLTYQYVQQVPDQALIVIGQVTPLFRQLWNNTMDMLDNVKTKSIEKAESNPNVYDIPDSADSSN
jgi:membrane protein required for colicin V production